MTDTWNIAETRKLIEARFGREYLDIVSPSLYSLSDRLAYARYHFQEVTRLLEDFGSRYLNKSSLLIISHGPNEEHNAEFQSFMIYIGAHSLACVLSIHALGDIMAYACYQSLGYSLVRPSLTDRNISLTSVQALIAKNPSHAKVAIHLAELKSHEAFKHIESLANRSKHQSVVKPFLSEDWTGKRAERHQIRIPAFAHKKSIYPEIDLKSFIETAYEIASSATIKVGNEIHRLLA